MTHVRTMRPGEMTAAQLEALEGATAMKPSAPLPEWLVIAEHVAERLPSYASKLGRTWRWSGGHALLLWLAVGALTVVLTMHILGDGTVREEARTTRVLVLWLVRRALAEDNNEPPPAFPYDEL